MKHYELTDQSTTALDGTTVYRIRALRDLPWHGVRAGDLGGYVASVDNLSGDAWVSGDAMVYGDAWVSDNAWVSGGAQVYGGAVVCGYALVYGNARVYGYALVTDHARVYGYAMVTDHARVYGYALVTDHARVCGNARVTDHARVCGNARVTGNADVSRRDHVLTISSASSESNPATLFRTSDGGHHLSDGCWDGTTADLRALADQDEWPSGCGEETRERFRPVLVAVADMCDAHMRAHGWGGGR